METQADVVYRYFRDPGAKVNPLIQGSSTSALEPYTLDGYPHTSHEKATSLTRTGPSMSWWRCCVYEKEMSVDCTLCNSREVQQESALLRSTVFDFPAWVDIIKYFLNAS